MENFQIDFIALFGLFFATVAVVLLVYCVPHLRQAKASLALQTLTVACAATMAGTAAEVSRGYDASLSKVVESAEKANNYDRAKPHATPHELETMVASKPTTEAEARHLLFEAHLKRLLAQQSE